MQRFLLLLLSMSTLSVVFGQWNPDPTENNLLVSSAVRGTSQIGGITAVSDGANGAFIAWEDDRNAAATGTDIYVTRILENGTVAPGFSAAGLLVCNATGTQDDVNIIADGAGGIVIAWRDARSSATNSNDIYAQRVTGAAALLWAANGVAVATGTVNEQRPTLALTSATRAAVVWRGTVDGLDLFANFINLSDGSKVLGTDITVISKTLSQTNQVVIPDGDNGFIVAWTDARVASNNGSIHAQRVNGSGTLLWGTAGNEADGLEISYIPGVNNHLTPAITSDGTIGGAIIVFGSTRVAATDANLYAQRVNGAGAIQWATNGVAVTLASGNQTDPIITQSGSTVVVAWRDLRIASNNAEIFTQSLNISDGSANWTADGVRITEITGNQPNSALSGFKIQSDGTGGATIIWDDARNGTNNIDVYAQKVNSSGMVQWQVNGAPVASREGSNQNQPAAVPVASGNIMVIWRDSRNSTSADLYGSILQTSGVLPTHFLQVQAAPRGKNIEVIWATSGEQNLKHYVVERSATGMQFEHAGVVNARNTQGRHSYAFIDENAYTGTNFYRIKSINNDGSSQLSKVVKVAGNYIVKDIISIYPNPTVASINLQMGTEVANGEYTVRIINAAGGIMQQVRLQKWQDTQLIQIGVSPLRAGLYRVQLVHASGKTIATEALLKQ